MHKSLFSVTHVHSFHSGAFFDPRFFALFTPFTQMWCCLKQFLSNCKHGPTSHSWHFHGVLLLHSTQRHRPMLALCDRSWMSLTGTGRWSHFLYFGLWSRGTPMSWAASSSWKYCHVMGLSWWIAHSSLCKMKLLVTAMSRKCWKMVTYHFWVLRCTDLVPSIWSEVSTPPMNLLYCWTVTGLGTGILCFIPSSVVCHLSTVSPLYTVYSCAHGDFSCIHPLYKQKFIIFIQPLGDLLFRVFCLVEGTPALPSLYVPPNPSRCRCRKRRGLV